MGTRLEALKTAAGLYVRTVSVLAVQWKDVMSLDIGLLFNILGDPLNQPISSYIGHAFAGK